MSGTFVIRLATEPDLDTLATFEVAIAKVSFDDDAVVDLATHRGKLAKALVRDPETLYVATYADDIPVGWLWLAINTNFLTQQRYANLRSLFVSPVPDRELIGEALLQRAVEYARGHGLTELTGKVHVDNYAMRTLYRRTGFDAVHLTMRRRLRDEDAGP